MSCMAKIQNPKAENKGGGRKNLIKAGIFFLAVCTSILIFIYRDRFGSLSGYGYLGIFLINILGSSTIIFPAPSILTALVGGSILNPFIVGVVSASGASIGELTGYFAGLGGKVLIKKDARYKTIETWMQKKGSLTLFVLAAIPNPLFDIAGISAGVTNFPLKKFMLATFSGKCVKFILVALLGLATGRVIR